MALCGIELGPAVDSEDGSVLPLRREGVMKHRGLLSVLLLFVPGLAYAQARDVVPTELEAFLANPAVTVVSERRVDEIRSTESTIAISIVEAVEQWEPGETMRGARVDLDNNAWHDSVYLDEEQIADLALQLQMMARNLGEQREESHPRHNELLFGNRAIGTQQCWILHPNQQRILCPSYRIVNGFETFSIQVNGVSGEVFPLATEHLVELARVVQVAKEELEAKATLRGEGVDGELLEAELSDEVVVFETLSEREMAISTDFEGEPTPTLEDASALRRSIVLGGLVVASLVAALALFRKKRRG